MLNQVYITDANVLIYLYQAGGMEAVTAYANTHDVAVTDQIRSEILNAPDPNEYADFSNFFSSGKVQIYDTNVGTNAASGTDTGNNPGERSIAEVVTDPAYAGTQFQVVSDDKFNWSNYGVSQDQVQGVIDVT